MEQLQLMTFSVVVVGKFIMMITLNNPNQILRSRPHHMLIPKGTVEGLPCILFVMITNHDDDRVEVESSKCDNAASYCGLQNNKYPDRKPMGFPFDRLGRAQEGGKDTLASFLTKNMMTQDTIIKFHETIAD